MITQFKKISLLSSILLFPFMALAQKMDKPQIDKFTNDTTYFTTTEKIVGNKGSLASSAENIEAYLSNNKGDIKLHLKVELTVFDHGFFRISQGNNVLVKLSDNTIITLSNIAAVESKREGIGPRITGRLCWTAEVACALSPDVISKISSSTITTIRVEADGQNLDFDVKGKDSGIIKKMIGLIEASR